jgi:hypothetical protein
MMARSMTSSNRRPDTLMQDRSPPTGRIPLATHGQTIHLGHGLKTRSSRDGAASSQTSEDPARCRPCPASANCGNVFQEILQRISLRRLPKVSIPIGWLGASILRPHGWICDPSVSSAGRLRLVQGSARVTQLMAILTTSDRPNGQQLFSRQLNFFRFMPGSETFAVTQCVFHLIQTDFDFHKLAAIRHGLRRRGNSSRSSGE